MSTTATPPNSPTVEKTTSRKRKVALDENGNPVKKVRQTNKVKYPLVKVQPRTAYQYFIMEKAEEARAAGAEQQQKLGSKELSQLWKDTEDREKWVDLAAKDRVRFFDEVRSHGYEIKGKKSERPTRPCSGFLLFARDRQKEYRDTHGVSYTDALKALGERWKDSAFQEEKAVYEEQARVLKEQWEKENQNAE